MDNHAGTCLSDRHPQRWRAEIPADFGDLEGEFVRNVIVSSTSFKLTVLVYRCLHSLAISVINSNVSPALTAEDFVHRRYRFDEHDSLQSATMPFGGRKPSLERSAARRHISSDSRCFPESKSNLGYLQFSRSFSHWQMHRPIGLHRFVV